MVEHGKSEYYHDASTIRSQGDDALNPFTDHQEYPPPFSPAFSVSLPDTKIRASSPPPYSDTPIPELALDSSFLSTGPLKLHMKGHYTSPNFEVVTCGAEELSVIDIDADSHWIAYEMTFKDTRHSHKTSNLFTMKRKDTTNASAKDKWYYTATTHGRNGKRLLEIETRPDLLTNKDQTTRLKFRNEKANELDALDMKILSSGKADVHYWGTKVGEITQTTSNSKPLIILDIWFPSIDPCLFVILGLVMDDRSMSVRRRKKRAIGREALGIGKGPGAGLALAYGIGSF